MCGGASWRVGHGGAAWRRGAGRGGVCVGGGVQAAPRCRALPAEFSPQCGLSPQGPPGSARGLARDCEVKVKVIAGGGGRGARRVVVPGVAAGHMFPFSHQEHAVFVPPRGRGVRRVLQAVLQAQ